MSFECPANPTLLIPFHYIPPLPCLLTMDTIRRIIGRLRSKGRGGGSSNKQDQEATPVQCNVLHRLRKMSRSMENVSLSMDKELSPSSACPDGDITLCNEVDRGGSFLTRKILSLSNLSRSSHPEVVQAKIESVLEKYGLVGSNLSLGRSSSLDQPFAWTRSGHYILRNSIIHIGTYSGINGGAYVSENTRLKFAILWLLSIEIVLGPPRRT